MHESILAPAASDPQNVTRPHLEDEDGYRRVMRRVGAAERAPASLVARALQLLRASRGERS
jgi:hypothetical protein